MSGSTLFLLRLVFLVGTAATLAGATDHIVGANRGWNPGINYTLWANNHTFYVNDLISFRYSKFQYNVYQVNQTGYDNCTIEGALGNWSSGKDFILLDKAKRYYFICGTGGCFNGMKVSVLVHPLPPPPTAAAAATNQTSPKSAAKAVFRPGSVVLGTLVVSLASILLGFEWI
ncbi:hypothetical protein HHK36_021263 [Tetracentron sinense]|uniref:Phytocyanin domain-containing protein n=1 Tax=Tetracentron sinense TaxID=13715 RepID=A0A834YWJ0_TETSI|nr:hypothetical protein HHK36_021263 [Tetracentron sinense]